jgi:hypothetical protein
MWKEVVVVVPFEVISRHLPGGPEETTKASLKIACVQAKNRLLNNV